MKRLISAVILSAAVVLPTMAQKSGKTLSNGYPFAQVPFTSVKISQNTFWGARLQAAQKVTIPLAFSKCRASTVTRISRWLPIPCSILIMRG